MTLDIGDIEDSLAVGRKGVESKPSEVVKRFKASTEIPSDCRPEEVGQVPGRGRIYMRTWGCSHNSSDSEYMGGLLAAAGYDVTSDKAGADLWLLNSCTVKTPSETAIRNQLGEATAAGVKVVVAGCVPQAAPTTDFLAGVSLLGVQQIDKVVDVVHSTLQGLSVRQLASKRAGGVRLPGADLSLPKIRKNPLVEILAINTGCLNHCTYCKTKQARGDLASYPVHQLVQRAVQSFQEGVKEIWLTSEDLGAYGRDIGTTLPELLRELVQVIPAGCRMRLGMTNPPYILDYLEDMAEILNHPRVYRFLHVPVQSASDAVLLDMRREYNQADFRRVVDFLRSTVPGIWIATDVICGFPSETAADFEETLQLVRDYRFPSLFINQYYPRPNTPAARMKRIDTVEVKKRTKAISALFASYSRYSGAVGRELWVVVTETASDGASLVGHSDAYEQVLLPASPCLMGAELRVSIVDTSRFSMRGRPFLSDWARLWAAYQWRRHGQTLLLSASLAALGIAALRTLAVIRRP